MEPTDVILRVVRSCEYRPGRVFDRTIGVEDVPAGYRAMADREALKVLVKP